MTEAIKIKTHVNIQIVSHMDTIFLLMLIVIANNGLQQYQIKPNESGTPILSNIWDTYLFISYDLMPRFSFVPQKIGPG